ncbi:t-SNARE [Macrolepiota fuliginosa MF-IS2]|uniref:t-SNARE n=1 Tax=Macrolepiota fuliginosa MF-IS2 TaxID=1400762 RepID=A0A9P6C4E9_9AGAR|nr:t-SNARE [Macrolepiota fuliginosa MF-IS2]
MPVQDRTNEFRACVDSIRNRSATRGIESKQRLLQKDRSSTKSEFSRMASGIGKEISNTTLKLNKLAQLAKRKTLFDDRPVEISELTYIIKQDIAHINKQIASLQGYVKQRNASGSTSAEGKQIEEHTNNVVMLLQSKLANTSVTFKDVLEVRTQVNANKPPDSVLYNSSRGDPMGDGTSNRLDFKGKGRATPHNDELELNLTTAEEGEGANGNTGGAFMQMQLMEQQDTYIQQRSTAIESIETTIAELGQIFTQLANMVAEQRETVQRIDENVLDIESNIDAAHGELSKYLASMMSNRWLMMKMFGVLIVFFLIFILVS